ncbi:site-specific DNA-methyltransferase [Croceiramulus getboli]|nr:site-specific DNA-methyltransferase [Flavobacteriaceae bacterium YJPT1-3]
MEKITKDHNLSQSENIVESNIDKLKALFPEIVTEGKIDFKVLQEVLGNELEEGEEYYRFTWAGKANARREAQKPSTGTLRPAPEESVDWDTTENLYIEGDNLEVLKLLQKGYAGKVKMIYIDPPYNTGKDFVYKDNYKDNLRNYQEVTGQIDKEGNKLSTNSDSDGRYHSNWLNMMYPRLRLARNLLKDDGVIFMSIDDNEIENLIKLCNEVFGEENRVDILKWKRKKQPSFLAKHTAKVMEYVLVYSKQKIALEKLSIEGTSDSTKKVINISNNESIRIFKKGVRVKIGDSGVIKAGVYKIRTMEVEYLNDVKYENGKTIEKVEVKSKFSTSQDNIDNYIDDELLFITSNYGLRRDVSEDEKGKRKSITDLLLKDWGDNQESDSEMRELFDTTEYFDYTKPSQLIRNLIKSNFTEDSIVLDFFSGSGTTAQSVMEMNTEDLGKRKHIQIQLPEIIDEKNKAFKDGYKLISEIGKERIRRAAKKIASAHSEKAKDLDLGFKVFKLDTSNIKGWDGNPDNLDDSLFDAQDNIKTDRTEHDVLYEILLKYGLDLTLPIEEKQIAGKTVFSVGYGALFICLADTITSKVAEGIGKWKEELQPEVCRVVFKDSGFTDVEKTNSVQTLKRFGITEIKSI